MKARKEQLDLITVIEDKARKEISKILFEFSKSVNKIQIGDMITDHYHTIEVNQTVHQTSVNQKSITIVYKGIELKKDGNPTKKQNDTVMYESNIEFHNKQPYEKLN